MSDFDKGDPLGAACMDSWDPLCGLDLSDSNMSGGQPSTPAPAPAPTPAPAPASTAAPESGYVPRAGKGFFSDMFDCFGGMFD